MNAISLNQLLPAQTYSSLDEAAFLGRYFLRHQG